jgi:hypothetical protein
MTSARGARTANRDAATSGRTPQTMSSRGRWVARSPRRPACRLVTTVGALTDELERLKLFVVEHSVRDPRLAHFKLLQDVRYLLGQRSWAMCNGRPQV